MDMCTQKSLFITISIWSNHYAIYM